MKRSVFVKWVVFMVAAVFLLSATLAVSAEKPWFVIKDSNGVCKVIQAKEKTPKTIAGPFTTKAEAQKAKDEQCPKKEKDTGKKPPKKQM
jgi:hypothetical protein